MQLFIPFSHKMGHILWKQQNYGGMKLQWGKIWLCVGVMKNRELRHIQRLAVHTVHLFCAVPLSTHCSMRMKLKESLNQGNSELSLIFLSSCHKQGGLVYLIFARCEWHLLTSEERFIETTFECKQCDLMARFHTMQVLLSWRDTWTKAEECA